MGEITAIAERVSNWGRWGDQDERGTANFITAEKRIDAAALIRTGRTFSLAIPMDSNGPQSGIGFRTNPIHLMAATGADPEQEVDLGGGARYTDDVISMPLQCATQWDSLAHIYYGDQLYNGFPAVSVDSRGAHRNGSDKVHEAFVSRGVLLDIARMLGVDCLEAGYSISVAELEAAERRQGTHVAAGDIVLVRTGLMGTHDATGSWARFHDREPGLGYETVEWLHDRSVAAIATDTSRVEAPSPFEGLMIPFHMLAIRDMGLHLGEFWYLEELARSCEEDGVYECFLSAQGLPITGAVGSPTNPIAIK